MPPWDNAPAQMVESSGFPFQLRIVKEIEQHPGRCGWQVLAYEHFWRDDKAGRSGFADIIAGYGMIRLVIECKRGTDATWLFLLPNGALDNTARAKCLSSLWVKERGAFPEWADLLVAESSPESEFCIVKGQADKEPMLERTASVLIEATQAIAAEEADLPRTRESDSWIYLPMIVTAANLQVCRFDPMAVDLHRGILSAAAATCEPVPFLRFRKALSGPHGVRRATSLSEAQAQNARTVFVVHADALGGLLERWRVSPGRFDQWPSQITFERLRAEGRVG